MESDPDPVHEQFLFFYFLSEELTNDRKSLFSIITKK